MSRFKFNARFLSMLLALTISWTALPRLYALLSLLLMAAAEPLERRPSWFGLSNPRIRYHSWDWVPEVEVEAAVPAERPESRTKKPESVVC